METGLSRSRAAEERERLEWPERDRRDLGLQASRRAESGQEGGEDGGACRRWVQVYGWLSGNGDPGAGSEEPLDSLCVPGWCRLVLGQDREL